jgi:O-antigen ligase
VSPSGSAAETRLGWAYLAVALVMGAAVVAGTSGTLLGPTESGVIAVILLLACGALALGAARWIPGLLFTLTPAVCVFNTRHGFFPFDYVVFALAFYLILDAIWRGDLSLPGPRSLHLAFLAVIASGLLTLFLARELSSFAGHLKRVIVGYLAMVIVFRFADRERWPWFALSIPVSGLAIAFLVIGVYLRRGFLVHKAYELRTFYSNVGWGSSNYVAAVLSLALLGSVILIVLTTRPWLRIVSALSLLPMGLAMALLVSRGTLVAVALGLLGLFVAVGGKRRWGFLALGALGTALLTQLPVFKVILLRFTLESQNFSYYARLVGWKLAFQRFVEHPLLGVGLGQGKFQTDALSNLDPHNYLLSVASETGILGLVAWIALLWIVFQTARDAARGDPSRKTWAISLGVLLAVAVLHSCYEPTFAGANYFFLLFWIAAILHRAADPVPS